LWEEDFGGWKILEGGRFWRVEDFDSPKGSFISKLVGVRSLFGENKEGLAKTKGKQKIQTDI
jgi:hypothetical protein